MDLINRDGIAHLRALLADGNAVAFLGAGASAPLYPTWGSVISELVEAAEPSLSADEAQTCRDLAWSSPDAVVEIVRRRIGANAYREVLRRMFSVRRDPSGGSTWTETHELVSRCNFSGVVTTNYDPGIVNARMATRPRASATGFTSWTDESALDGWRTGDVFGGEELPVLYAHGHHNQPDAIVLATTEYRRAYSGKLAAVLGQLVSAGRLVWIGFSFADQRIAAVLREVSEHSGTRLEPGQAPRHIATIPWDPDPSPATPRDPGVLASLCEIQFACRPVLYPAPNGDHRALRELLAELTDERYPPAADRPPVFDTSTSPTPNAKVKWVHGSDSIPRFTGRGEELQRLDRWAGDDEVKVIGVTAWGGAGKTALITEWLSQRSHQWTQSTDGAAFSWSFYENPSADDWAKSLLEWAGETFGVRPLPGPLATQVVSVAQQVPMLLFLDGLEVLQESGNAQFGRLLSTTLAAVLTSWCLTPHKGLALLTSRFAFADLEQFDGGPARMLDVPPLSVDEGAELLQQAGAGWLTLQQRRELSAAMDGHALAVNVLASAIAQHPPMSALDALVEVLRTAPRTDARVARVLQFYADRLGPEDRQLVAVVSLFQRPVEIELIRAIDATVPNGGLLHRCDAASIELAVRQRLYGVLTYGKGNTVSAHPLVRDAFRPLILSATSARAVADVSLGAVPAGADSTRDDARVVVETIELLLDADEWKAADALYQSRFVINAMWNMVFPDLLAEELGLRCALAFVGTEQRRQACREHLLETGVGTYANDVGTQAFSLGDIPLGERFLSLAVEEHQSGAGARSAELVVDYQNLAWLQLGSGRFELARETALRGMSVVRRIPGSTLQLGVRAQLATALFLAGETARADAEFAVLAELELAFTHGRSQPISLRGAQWAEFLLQTGRRRAARRLILQNLALTDRESTWDRAIFERLLGLSELADGRTDAAAQHFVAAMAAFRAGGYIADSAWTLIGLAEQCRRDGRPDEAFRHCSEAIALSGPRRFVPAHAAALATRAWAAVDLGGAQPCERARDDADHAMRLSSRTRRIPWQELEALEAHAMLDARQGETGHDERAAALRSELIPVGLDPDPLATAERLAGFSASR